MELPFRPSTLLKIVLVLIATCVVVEYCFNVTGYTYDYSTISHFLGYNSSKEPVLNPIHNGNNLNLTTTVMPLPECPIDPPNLVGLLKVLTSVPSFEETEQAEPEVKSGGRYQPLNCTARQKVAIVIPFRNREDHLKMFLRHMHPFLQRQQLDYGIYVVEQNEKEKFNRAALLNVGFVESLKIYNYNCFVFHDVDMLPEDDRNIYRCNKKHPRHLTVAIDKFNYKLPYDGYFGGGDAMTRQHFELVNGFSNEFWGWGGEDDDFLNRVRNKGLQITRYPAEIAKYKMSKHNQEVPSPERFDKLNTGFKRQNKDGLINLESKYKRLNVTFYKLYTRILVELYP